MIPPVGQKIKRNLDRKNSLAYNELYNGGGTMVFFKLFLTVILCTVGVTVVCGLAVCLCSFLFRKLCGDGFGYAAVIATSVIGTPVHELSHALMCLLFAHRIEHIRLWKPNNEDGRLGFVDHSYNPKNPYATVGNFFIGMGPLIFGCAVILLLLYFVFPETFRIFVSSVGSVPSDAADAFSLIRTSFEAAFRMYAASSVAWYFKVGALILIFSVSLHVNLSPEDLKGSTYAIPWLLVLCATFSGVCTFFGTEAVNVVISFFLRFAGLTVSLFAVVLVFSVLLVAVALVIFLLRLLFGERV